MRGSGEPLQVWRSSSTSPRSGPAPLSNAELRRLLHLVCPSAATVDRATARCARRQTGSRAPHSAPCAVRAVRERARARRPAREQQTAGGGRRAVGGRRGGGGGGHG